MKNLHAVVARSTFPGQNVQNTPFSDHFWKLRCQKSARRCGAKHILKSKCTNTPGSDHFWKLRCRKSARRCGAKHILKSKCTKHTIVGPLLEVAMSKKCAHRCGAKHISKSKCTKHTIVGPLLEVAMSKKCTPLWREAHFQSKCTKHHMFAPLLEVRMLKKCTSLWREAHFEVKMYKTPHVRATFGGSDVEKVHVVVARSTFRSQNAENTPASDHFWKLRCRKSACRCGVKMYKTHQVRTTFGGSDVASLQDRHYITGHSIHYTPVHYITLHYTPVHSTTLNYTTPHYITLNETATQIDR